MNIPDSPFPRPIALRTAPSPRRWQRRYRTSFVGPRNSLNSSLSWSSWRLSNDAVCRRSNRSPIVKSRQRSPNFRTDGDTVRSPAGPPAQARENPLRLRRHRLVRRDVHHPERLQPSEQISVLLQISVEARGLSGVPVDVAKTDHRRRRAERAREEERELVYEVPSGLDAPILRAIDADREIAEIDSQGA